MIITGDYGKRSVRYSGRLRLRRTGGLFRGEKIVMRRILATSIAAAIPAMLPLHAADANKKPAPPPTSRHHTSAAFPFTFDKHGRLTLPHSIRAMDRPERSRGQGR